MMHNISFLMNTLGFVMDRNPKHFPTLLIICLLMSIIIFVTSNLVYFFYKRRNLLNARASMTNGAALPPEGFGEDEQKMADYLRDQEDK
jgi:hypothetical protein